MQRYLSRMTWVAVLVGVAVFALGIVPAHAGVVINVTYTGDNIVGAFYQNGASPVAVLLGANADNWQIADEAELTLAGGQDYQLIFRVRNLLTTPASGNPAAFLAQVTGGIVGGMMVTSSSWQVASVAGGPDPTDFNTLSWSAATQYGNNGGDNIWTGVNSGPVADIHSSAQWIWDDSNFQSTLPTEELWIRVTFTTVPEPGSVAVWSLVLGGCLWLGSRRRNRRAA